MTGRVWIIVGLAALAGCTNKVQGPGDLFRKPVTVFLVDQGRTSSIVLPREDGTMVRWAFGQWGWYAIGNNGPVDAVWALFIPTSGTLGRAKLTGPATEKHVREVVHDIEFVYPIVVEREKAERLDKELEEEFARQSAIQVINRKNDMTFVKFSWYHGFHNSNHQTCMWLEELGCRVRGSTLISSWEVAPGTSSE